jgi:hypothetical protein
LRRVFSVGVREDGDREAVGVRVRGGRDEVAELLVCVRSLLPRGGRCGAVSCSLAEEGGVGGMPILTPEGGVGSGG